MPEMEVFMSVNSPNQLISVHKLINPDTWHLLIKGQILQNQNRNKIKGGGEKQQSDIKFML